MVDNTMMIHCVIMRGGTSKAVFFRNSDLPVDQELREKIILVIMGSPDETQIDGLGGATALTSKIAIIGPSEDVNADVDYTYGAVSRENALIDWGGNCGNISSAVGPFAIDQGFVKPVEPYTTVRIRNTNTGKYINAKVPVKDGKVVIDGDYKLPGVPGSAARIGMEFVNPAGATTGKLLPTGNPVDDMILENGTTIRVTLIDAANPAVLVRADELDLKGNEMPAQLLARPDVLEILEEIRSKACETMGFVDDWHDATKLSPSIPKVGFVSEPVDFVSESGEFIKKENMHIVVRMMSMQMPHAAFPVTGGVYVGGAAGIPGTLINEIVCKTKKENENTILIGHPEGVMDAEVRMGTADGELIVEGVAIGRTARMIMEGYACVPRRVLKKMTLEQKPVGYKSDIAGE